jgi:CelD/BcsL family acetyltransferase involved in cellulose biosynthesis
MARNRRIPGRVHLRSADAGPRDLQRSAVGRWVRCKGGLTSAPTLQRASAEVRSGLHVARSLEEVERLRPLWERVPVSSPDADLDLFAGVVAGSPEVSRPHVVAMERADRPPAMAIARLEESRISLKVGYRAIARPKLRTLVVVYSGLAGSEDEQASRALLGELQSALIRGEADMLYLSKLRTDTPLFALARGLAPWHCRDHLLETVPRTDVAVPHDLDAFLKARSRNTRDNVKRYGKRLERAHGDDLAVRSYREPEQLDEALAAMEAVAATTYQRALGVGFREEPRQRAVLERAARKDVFRAWVLSIAGNPVAFWHGLSYGGTFYIGSPGYDPAFGNLRVGQYLQMRMMEDLCADPAVQRLDYGFGDAQYKRSFGDRTWTEADVMIFAPRLRALCVNGLRTAVGGATRTAKRALGPERVGALRRRARRTRTQPR